MWTAEDFEKGWCVPSDVGQPKADHERWTLTELTEHALPGYLEGTVKPPSAWREAPVSSPPLVPPANAKEVVQEYLETYNDIGGRAALVKQAKLNPMKFYDQLLKLLMAMEAPKAAVAVQVNIERLEREEMVAMSSADLKRYLMESKD
jgi:hypothetical protein